MADWGTKFFLVMLFCALHVTVWSQVYLQDKNRYTFAQTTFGYNMDFSPASGYSYRYVGGTLEKFKIGNSFTPTITITGLHFWGHMEFFTGFALPTINVAGTTSYDFSRSAGTGFKVFPIQIRERSFRPFVGSSISSFSYKYSEGAKYRRLEFPLLLGVTYSFKHGLLEFGANYYPANKYEYFLTKNQTVRLSVPALTFSLDYKYFFDLSKGSAKREVSGETSALYEKLKKGKRLNSFSIAAGPAYSFFVGSSSYNERFRPYLDDYKISNVFPDFGLGYYMFNPDASVNLSYRFYRASLTGFDVEQTVRRKSLALEAFKFFGDYHGFVPFIGPIVSREFIQVKEFENGAVTIERAHNFWSAGIIAGWDVRPTNIDWWGVRTNIRYFPFLDLGMPADTSVDFRQIEVNFLQLVLYPNRIAGTFFQ